MIKKVHVPKYQEIINRIRAGIADGTLRPGDKLPVRDELMNAYQVTRTTIDRAISELIRDGDLVASRRNGTFIADDRTDRAAVVTWKESVQLHRSQWNEASNFYAMFGGIFSRLPESEYEVIAPTDAIERPLRLRRFRRILWNSMSREEFEQTVEAVGDRGRFLLLNREYPDCDFISTDHHRAAFDLTELFLRHLPETASVVFLDIPDARNLSSRELWESRLAGFIDACEKYRRFYRIVALRQNDFEGNVAQLVRHLGNTTPEAPGIMISPTRATVGSALGFLFRTGRRFNIDGFYGDFDNDHAQLDYGLPIPSVVQNFAAIARYAAEHFRDRDVRLHVPHTIINSPWPQSEGEK